MEMEIWHYWVIAGIVLLIAEIFTIEFLLASFSVGAFAAAVAAYFDVPMWGQYLVFACVSFLVFFALRPFVMRALYKSSSQVAIGTAAMIGREATVIEQLDQKSGHGRVRIGGEEWRAVTDEATTLKEGALVTIVAVEGATLRVKGA